MTARENDTLENGARFGAYEIRSELGRGGMGAVYLARGPAGDVALKVLHARAHPDVARRFERETRVALEVRHPNIANALDAGAVEGRPYLASEYVDGVNVAQLITMTGPLGEPHVRLIARDVAAALSALDDARTLHRDLKPQNILVGRDGSCRVVDFGLALPRTGPISLRTQTGAFLGTPLYVAPEQILGDGLAIDGRCDLYALGCVLFYCLVGRAPFRGRSQFAILQQHLDAPVPSLARLDVEVSQEMDALVERLLAKDPARRPDGAADLLADNEDWLGVDGAAHVVELGVRVGESIVRMRNLRTATRADPAPYGVDAAAVDDAVSAAERVSPTPERVVVLEPAGAPGPAAVTLRSGGPGRRWIIHVIGGNAMTLPAAGSEADDGAAVSVRVIDGAAVIQLAGDGVEASLNDRTLADGPRSLTRRARITVGPATFNLRLVSPPDDDELMVGDEPAPWGPAVVARNPADGGRAHVLVPGRFVLPGGAEIIAAGGGLWLRRDTGCSALRPGCTFRSGAIEVRAEEVPQRSTSSS